MHIAHFARPIVLSMLLTAGCLWCAGGCGRPQVETSTNGTSTTSADGTASAASAGETPPAMSASGANASAATSDAAADTTPPAEPQQSLAEHAERVRTAFQQYEEVEELIYPKGWVRRRLVPQEVNWELADAAATGQAVQGVVRVRLQPLCSRIHPARDEAAADDELLPAAPAASREEMLDNPLNPRLDPLLLTIHYAYRDGRWQRTDWSVEPAISRGRDWLDRMGIP